VRQTLHFHVCSQGNLLYDSWQNSRTNPLGGPIFAHNVSMEFLVLKLSQMMTQRAVCELLHMPKSTLSDLSIGADDKEFAKMLKRHAHRILPYISSRITNAMSEGINRVIKIVKNRASGFANLEAFTDMIFLTVGDLDLPAQISTEFHTL